MVARWEFRDELLVVTEIGLTSNDELRRVVVDEALADDRARPGLRVLWDARGSENAVSSDDMAWRFDTLEALGAAGRISRIALILRRETLPVELARELPNIVESVSVEAFVEVSDALRWLANS